MTLVEVVASLALMGSLMVTVILAQSRLTRQYHLARQKTHAVHLADELLHGWANSREGIPRNGQGEVAEMSLAWQTSTATVDDFLPLRAEKITLQVYAKPASGMVASPQLLCQVELLGRPLDDGSLIQEGTP